MKRVILSIAALVFATGIATADGPEASHAVNINVPAVALIDIEGTNQTIPFTFNTINEAGASFEAVNSNNDLWLNLTSVVAPSKKNKVQVKISENLVEALTLSVQAASSTTGKGNRGTVSSKINLTEVDQSIITNIGSGYTGDGQNFGFQLTYSLTLNEDDFSTLTSLQDKTITVEYTMSEE